MTTNAYLDFMKGTPTMSVLSQRNYRLFWVGESVSLLGDQFFFIALPWLVLSLTDDALAIGLVYAFAGIPRAGFMLFGGILNSALPGIAVAFGINTFSFLISVITLLMIHTQKSEGQPLHQELHIFKDLKEVVIHVWNDTNLRAVMLMSIFVNFFSQGPFFVGIPILAEARFEQGASAFGIIMAAYGIGSLVGTLLGNAYPNPFPHRRGWFLLFLVALQGPKLILIGLLDKIIMISLVVFVGHIALGYAFLVWMTWMQQHTEANMRGRVTSLFFLYIALLYPLSAILSGVIVEHDVTILFVVAGILYSTVVVSIEILYKVRDLPTLDEALVQPSQIDLRRVTHTIQALR